MRAKFKEDDHRKETHREELKKFNDYCNERWGMGRAHAARLITGSQVAVNLIQEGNVMPHGTTLPACEIQPTSEYQIRPLAILNPVQQCEVWKGVVRTADGKVVTYQQVKALVAELIGPAPSPPPQKKQEDPEPFSDYANGVFWEDAKQIVGLHAEIPRWEVWIVSCESNQGTQPGA